MSWTYEGACEAVVKAARAADPRRRMRFCEECGDRFLSSSAAPDATACAFCYRRWRREDEEAADRELYARYLAGERALHPYLNPPEVEAEGSPENAELVLFS